MNNAKKTLLISFSLLLLQSTTACSTMGQVFNSRDNGSQTTSSDRRAPRLNPSDDPGYASRRIPAENMPLLEGNAASPTTMSAPVTPVQINNSNPPAPIVNSASPANYTPPVAPAAAAIPATPVTLVATTNEVSPMTPMAPAPVAAVTTPATVTPASATNDTPANLRGPKAITTSNNTVSTPSTNSFGNWFHNTFSSNKKPTPSANSASTTGSAAATPSADATPDNSPYPSLNSVPPAPEPLPKEGIKGEFNSLNTQQKDAESNRGALMNDQNATVMTSPQTGQLVANPADAVPAPVSNTAAITPPEPAPAAQPPATTNSNTGTAFSKWVHGFFSSNKKPATDNNTATSTSPSPAPVINTTSSSPESTTVSATMPSTPAADAAALAPSSGTTQDSAPVVYDITNHSAGTHPTLNTPADAAQAVTTPTDTTTKNLPPLKNLPPVPTSQALAPAPVAASPSSSASSSSHTAAAQPTPAAATTSNLPDISQLSRQTDSPVDLVQPSDMTSSGEYIGDSRYPAHN